VTSVEELKEAIITACDLGGAYGKNLSETKEVLVRVTDNTYLPVNHICVSFYAGKFVFVLDAR
jgi:hypothetical protein